MAEKRKQLTLTLLYIILICLFLGGGLWFRGHPLFSGQGLRLNGGSEVPEATYAPYAATSGNAALPAVQTTSTELPTPLSRFYTTERATVFTFSGIERAKELDAVLAALKSTNSRATFFVTAEEMELYPERIEAISRAGHSLGISVVTLEGQSAAQLLDALEAQADTLREKYGADYEIFVRPSYGSGSDELRRAAFGGGFRLMRELKEAVPEKVSRMTDAEEIMATVFNKNEPSLQRGEILHFQMGLLQHDDDVLGHYIERLVEEKCVYPILPANELAEQTEFLYTYPLPEDEIPNSVKNQIYPGHLAGLTEEEIFEVIRSGYIGNWWVRSAETLPGFNDEEIHKLDRIGLIENDQNYVFLTFDDWGTDGMVDRLLHVLEKHGATATFFVRSNYVSGNPNLLRSIAAAGHTIGAHTHSHMPLSKEIKPDTFIQLSPSECKALEQDLVLCYDALQSIVGDMVDADGKPSLSLLFRQPTLAVGRNGLETVFDCGYTYAVAGYYSTGDYQANSVDELVTALRQYVRSGAVIVMHFSDNAQYTPEAVDQFLSKMEYYKTGYRFVGLNKVLS